MPRIKPICLDGATLEGGGQLVRVAFCLAAITAVPVHVFNIRANRATRGQHRQAPSSTAHGSPIAGRGAGRGKRGHHQGSKSGSGSSRAEGGAKESHLAALLWLARRCNAHVEGAAVGSREITFTPGAVVGAVPGRSVDSRNGMRSETGDPDDSVINLERPGSVCLILQCILPYLLFVPQMPSTSTLTASAPAPSNAHPTAASTQLTLRGGTNVSKAMSVDYMQHVFLPMLHKLSGGAASGLPDIHLAILQRGWAGSASQLGEVEFVISRPDQPATGDQLLRLQNFNATGRGDITRVSVVIVAHGAQTRETLFRSVCAELAALLDAQIPIDLLVDEESHDIRRLYVLLVAHTSAGYRLGRDFLGTGRRPRGEAEADRITREAARTVAWGLGREIARGGCVDQFLADQLVVFQALAKGGGAH